MYLLPYGNTLLITDINCLHFWETCEASDVNKREPLKQRRNILAEF
jgi:hypothetical protein